MVVDTVETTYGDEAILQQSACCVPGVPNKPMVPTAPVAPVANPSRPLRRHIGQPLGRRATGCGQQVMSHARRGAEPQSVREDEAT